MPRLMNFLEERLVAEILSVIFSEITIMTSSEITEVVNSKTIIIIVRDNSNSVWTHSVAWEWEAAFSMTTISSEAMASEVWVASEEDFRVLNFHQGVWAARAQQA